MNTNILFHVIIYLSGNVFVLKASKDMQYSFSTGNHATVFLQIALNMLMEGGITIKHKLPIQEQSSWLKATFLNKSDTFILMSK